MKLIYDDIPEVLQITKVLPTIQRYHEDLKKLRLRWKEKFMKQFKNNERVLDS
jgi:hypothetical protein